MASAKFPAFQFASEEFNSDLARLVEGFTQNLLKLIQEECVRNEDSGEDDETGSKKSSPFSSPKGTVGGKVLRKKTPTKRGRPVKDDTDVVIDVVDDMRSVSDELTSRVEIVRNSSASPRVSMDAASKFDSVSVCLDDMMTSQQEPTENVVEEQTSTKKGKEKKEKVVKEPKEKKGKKGDVSPDTTEPAKEPELETISSVLAEDDDNDGIEAEVSATQELSSSVFEKTNAEQQLEEETDYVDTGVLSKLQAVITSSQENSQEDDIVIGDDLHDDMSQPPPDDEDEDEQEDEDKDGVNDSEHDDEL